VRALLSPLLLLRLRSCSACDSRPQVLSLHRQRSGLSDLGSACPASARLSSIAPSAASADL
jgi:hypothetical protein